MQCPFCAESIQDAAIVCRFCGATKTNGIWKAPEHFLRPSKPTAHKANFTIKLSAFFFLLSALFELIPPTAPVPLFGAVRGGVAALCYHLINFSVFASMGVALWQAYPSGYRIACIGTIVYTLLNLIYLLDYPAREGALALSLQSLGVEDMVNSGSILWGMNLFTVVFILCWWGFLLYLRYHRSYFTGPPAKPGAGSL